MNHLKARIESLKSKLINGVAPAMATPLEADGHRVNTAVVAQLVDFLIEANVKGLFVGGTTGEGILLPPPERQRLHQAAVTAANGRVPVLAHVGANDTETAVVLAQHAAGLGVDAIAAVTPYYYGVSDDGLAAYYQAVAQAAPDTLLLLYDIPHLAVNSIGPVLVQRLSQAIPSLAGMKTSNANAQMVNQLLQAAAEHHVILAGNESIALGLLALGAHGLISGLSTAVPEPFVALTQAFAEGDMAEARRQQQIINRILALLPAGARIGALKSILAERGLPMGTAVPPRPTLPNLQLWPKIEAILAG